METETTEALKRLEEKITAVHESVEKTRRYMFWSFMLQLAIIALPLFVLMFAIPFALSNFSGLYDGLL